MWLVLLLVLGIFWLAWSNGANDNFKGVATLYVNRRRQWRTIRQILITWITTLPLGLLLGAGVYWLLQVSGAGA